MRNKECLNGIQFNTFYYFFPNCCFERGLIELMNEVEAACKEYKRQFKR